MHVKFSENCQLEKLSGSQFQVCLQYFTFLGGFEKEQCNEKPLAEDVVIKLTAGFHKRGYNVTTNNFFTTVKVAVAESCFKKRTLHLLELFVLTLKVHQKK